MTLVTALYSLRYMDKIRKDRDRLRLELDKERQERKQLIQIIEEQAAAVRNQGEQSKLLTGQRTRAPSWQRWTRKPK